MLLPGPFLTTPVADGGTVTSAVISTRGLSRGAVGLKSDHGGTLTVTRYVDAQGLVPLNAGPAALAIAANVANSVGWSDGLPCGSIQIKFVNNAGAVANLSEVTVGLTP